MRPHADAPRYGRASGGMLGFAALTTVMFATLRVDWSAGQSRIAASTPTTASP